MKTLASIIITLVLACGLAVPVLAYSDDDNTITKMFQLTIHGDPPANNAFILFYPKEGEGLFDESSFIVLCADASQSTLPLPPDIEIMNDNGCKGDGTVYTHEVEFERGTKVAYLMARINLTDETVFNIVASTPLNVTDEGVLPLEYETMYRDTVNSGSYDYNTLILPVTGGEVADSVVWGSLAGLVTLAAGLAARRRSAAR